MAKQKNLNTHMRNVFMVGRTKGGDPVWRTNGKGIPYLLPYGEHKENLPWGPKRWFWRRLAEPHLSYCQVSTASTKSKKILRALRLGPIYERKGLVYSRCGQLLMSRAVAKITMWWLDGNGIKLTRTPEKNRVRIDLDVAATKAAR